MDALPLWKNEPERRDVYLDTIRPTPDWNLFEKAVKGRDARGDNSLSPEDQKRQWIAGSQSSLDLLSAWPALGFYTLGLFVTTLKDTAALPKHDCTPHIPALGAALAVLTAPTALREEVSILWDKAETGGNPWEKRHWNALRLGGTYRDEEGDTSAERDLWRKCVALSAWRSVRHSPSKRSSPQTWTAASYESF